MAAYWQSQSRDFQYCPLVTSGTKINKSYRGFLSLVHTCKINLYKHEQNKYNNKGKDKETLICGALSSHT